MARTVKCCICKKDLKKEDAYMFIYTSQSGKEYRKYACSLEEVENDKREKELYRKIQYLTDDILGYKCVNNTRNAKIKELQDAGFTNEQIFRCFKKYKDEIEYWINANGIDKEYNKIAYMFGVVNNVIKDFSIEDERANQWKQYKQTEEEVEVEVEDIEVPTDMKVKKRKTLF
jgi:hypothetical protein